MHDAFYQLLEETDAGLDATTARVRSTVHTTGPWAAGLQHAGPPSALLTRAVRRLGGLPPNARPRGWASTSTPRSPSPTSCSPPGPCAQVAGWRWRRRRSQPPMPPSDR